MIHTERPHLRKALKLRKEARALLGRNNHKALEAASNGYKEALKIGRTRNPIVVELKRDLRNLMATSRRLS